MIKTHIEEDLHIYDIVLELVGDFHDQVLELGAIDPPRCGDSKCGKKPNIARGRIEGHECLMETILWNSVL